MVRPLCRRLMPGLPTQTTHHVHADMPAKALLRTEQCRAAQAEVDDLRLLAAEATRTHSKVGHDTRSSTGRAGAARFLRWCVHVTIGEQRNGSWTRTERAKQINLRLQYLYSHFPEAKMPRSPWSPAGSTPAVPPGLECSQNRQRRPPPPARLRTDQKFRYSA